MWRLVKLVAGGGMLVVLGTAALIVWPLLWPPDPDASVQLVNGRLLGEATGYVGHIDREARTLDVSASLVGWRPVVLVVNESTAIVVHDRQGGFGDLWKDMPVRVSYEVVGDRRLARSIEVVSGDDGRSRGVNGAATPAVVAPPAVPPPATVSTPPAGPPVPAGAADPGPVQPAPDTPPAGAVASPPPANLSPVPEPARRVELPPAKPAPVPEPARRAEAPPAKPAPVPEPARREALPSAKPVPEPARRAEAPPAKPAPAPDPPPRRVEVPAAKPAPTAPPPQREAPPAAAPRVEPAPPSPGRSSSPSETDTGDGAAAIDWLLKGSRGGR